MVNTILLEKHNKEVPFKYDHYDKPFVIKSKHTCHQENAQWEKPLKCDHCAKAIVLNSNLTSHQITHIKEKPCKYDECDKSLLKKFILFVITEHTMVRSYINVTSIIKKIYI